MCLLKKKKNSNTNRPVCVGDTQLLLLLKILKKEIKKENVEFQKVLL
jgi:hypothetical protein